MLTLSYITSNTGRQIFHLKALFAGNTLMKVKNLLPFIKSSPGRTCNIHSPKKLRFPRLRLIHSRSTADLLTVLSDRITMAFNRSWTTRAVAVDISKTFDRFWYTGLLHKLKSYGISGQVFGFISFFLSNRRPWVVLDGKFSQEYSVISCNTAIYADDTIL